MNPDPEAELRERRELADSRLWTAIVEHADAYHLDRDGDILDQFGVIAFWTNADRTIEPIYTRHFHTEGVPNHVALGLFDTAYRLESEGEE